MNLGRCPHCGKSWDIFQAVRITGKGKRRWESAEDESVVDIPRMTVLPYSDAVRCGWCYKIRRDWQAVDGKLVRGE